MGNSTVRNLIGLLILIVLSFTVGIMAADSATSAVLIIFAIVGTVGVVAMGRNVWMLLFFLVPFGQVMPMFKVSAYFFYVIPIFLYWCVLVILGHARFTWRKLPGADIFMLVFMAYMATIIYRFPAIDHITSGLLGIKTAYYTFRFEYHLCIFVLIFYLTFSCIPFEKKKLHTVIKWGVIVKLILLFLVSCFGLESNMEENNETLENTLMYSTRLGMFSTFAIELFVFTYASAPLRKLLCTPKAVAALLISLSMVLLSGFRNRLGRMGLTLIGVSIIKKEYMGIIAAAFLGLCTLTVINSRSTLDQLPYSVQRVIGAIPWMDVNPNIKKNGHNSSEWRFEMWRWALDPRAGYIKNYMWGDGCLVDAAQQARDSRALARKEIERGEQQNAARWRAWHSGFIAVLQELGVAGLLLVIIGYLYALFATIRIGAALRNTPYLKYFLVYTYAFLQTSVTFYFLPGSTYYFLLHLSGFSFLKLFHWIAEEEGRIKPGARKKYLPILIQEENTANAN